ncbi:hypothetical protein LCGC14_2060580 [marine sediment metagenome]|uniref:Uncharacterized protein n=1 Tax=marine sediment metagenome TaxID=412755 RepID=A0A0F9ELG1_9ZZZZ
MNLSIVVGGKSFWYTFDDDSWGDIIKIIISKPIADEWVTVKGDFFKISEIQAVLHWKSIT